MTNNNYTISPKLRIVFAGTPEIANIALQKLLTHNYKVDLLITQPDRPKGRGNKLAINPIKQLAMLHNIEVLQPESFKNNPIAIAKIKAIHPDIIIVVAYGLIIPQELLDIPRLGCINLHVSLLPRWRGAAPIQHAIIAGDLETGVTIMQMDQGLDTGGILLQESIPITSDETASTLHDKLANLGANMLIEYLINHKSITPTKQDNIYATYASKINKSDAKINWNESAIQIERKIRGFNPMPVAFTTLNSTLLIKLWQAQATTKTTKEPVGYIIGTDDSKQQLLIACGNGSVLAISELQLAGKARQTAAQFINGYQNLCGKSLDVV